MVIILQILFADSGILAHHFDRHLAMGGDAITIQSSGHQTHDF